MAGRPRSLADVAKRKKVQGILSVGGTREVAARYVGVHPRTLANEIRRDPEFAKLVREAETGVEIRLLQLVLDAAGSATHWRAAAWQLERRFPQRYGRRQAGLFTADQVDALLRQLCEVILDEVPAPRDRRKILTRVDALLGGLSTSPRRRLTAREKV